MARGVNKYITIGNLGADPVSRTLPGGGSVCTFSVGNSEQWTDKRTGQKQTRTEWTDFTAFPPLSDICQTYLRKGSQVYVESQKRTEKYQDKDGQDRYATKFIVRDMQMLGSNPNAGNNQGYQQQPQGHQQPPAQQGYQQAPPQPPQGYQQAPQQPQGYQQAPQAPQQAGGQPQPQQQGYQRPPMPGAAGQNFEDDIPF